MTTSNDNLIDGAPQGAQHGLVVKKALGAYTVRSADRAIADRLIACTLAGNLRKQLEFSIADPSSMRRRVLAVKELDSVDPVAVGDHVVYLDAGDGAGSIVEILPRRNKLSRPVTDGNRRYKQGGRREQVLVANVDQIVVVMPAANPPPHWELLDRYLASAEAAGIPAVICLTKTDLREADEALCEIDRYRRIGYRVVLTSAVTAEGLVEIKDVLTDRVSVLWGKSGVGKTTLLNAIEPGLGLRVKDVNAHNSEGRHTTTTMEMFELAGGGSVIDTPGQRAFKLWDEIFDFAQLLPEMRPFIGRCKFGLDCTHTREPGCAIKTAVQTGAISARRYDSFLGMRDYFDDK